MEKGFILLPGCGVFYLVRYPARIDNKAESIIPPGYSVDFVPSPFISDYFLAYIIAEKTNTSFHFWNEELKSLSRDIRNLDSSEIFDLGQLGFFKKDDSGNIQYVNNGLKGIIGINSLGVLPCSPIPIHYKSAEKSPLEEKEMFASQPISPTESDAKKKRRMGFLGWFLLILGAVIFSSILYDSCNRELDSELEIPPFVAEERFNQAPNKLYVDSFQKEDSNSFENDYLDFPGVEYDYQYSDIDKDEFEIDESIDENEYNYNLQEDESPADIKNQALENDYVVVSGRCIIITGSFSRESNIRNQSLQLEKMGYSVYTENIGMLTRVGVLIDCYSDVLYRELDNLRSTIEAGAWIMENN